MVTTMIVARKKGVEMIDSFRLISKGVLVD